MLCKLATNHLIDLAIEREPIGRPFQLFIGVHGSNLAGTGLRTGLSPVGVVVVYY